MFSAIKIGYIPGFPIQSLYNEDWKLAQKLFAADVALSYLMPQYFFSRGLIIAELPAKFCDSVHGSKVGKFFNIAGLFTRNFPRFTPPGLP